MAALSGLPDVVPDPAPDVVVTSRHGDGTDRPAHLHQEPQDVTRT